MINHPLAVYIHWPFCKSKCPYCDFNSHVRERVEQERWKNALLAELEHMRAAVPDHTATSIFFGGGTPSLMPPDTAAALIERVKACWSHDPAMEITLEANPTSVEADTFAQFRQAGINRVSLGVQSLRDSELKFLGRGHSASEALAAMERARKAFDRTSFDLIYARPQQTLAEWEAELSEALALSNGHLSLYQLTIEENTAFHHAYAKGGFTLPDEALSEALYRLTEELTQAHGLAAYEVSNYATPGQESRHNVSYWQGDDYIGIGPGAHGRLKSEIGNQKSEKNLPVSDFRFPTPGAQRLATQTLKSPERWLESVERRGHGLEIWQKVDSRQEAEERIMMGLRMTRGLDSSQFAAQTGLKLDDCINLDKKAMMVSNGLLSAEPGTLRPTLKGRLVLNALTAELLTDGLP